MKSTDFPSNGRDWEARRYTDFDISPNRRGRDTDYPVNDDNSPMKIANFNGVGGGTHDLHGALPAHAPVGLPGEVARRRRRRLAGRLLGARAVLRRERPHDGRVRPRRRSGLSAAQSADAADPARQDRHALCPGDEQAGLALVAVGHHHRHHRLRRPCAVHQPRPLHAGLRAGRQGQHRHHLLAASPSAPASSCARAAGCARSPPTSTAWRPARSTTMPRGASTSSRPRS